MASARRGSPSRWQPLSADAFPDGVWFVDLSALRDASLVIPAIAQALGVQSRSASLPSLVSALGHRQLLLLLDNFEQVIDAASLIAELLQGVPLLNVLVTSREPLKISGEREYPIAPLPVPVDTTNLSGVGLGQLDAARLFAERAQAVLERMVTFLHTMVRITDPQRSRGFYEALGFRFSRDMDIVRNGELEATNYFFSLGDDENVLELTYNHDGRTYDLGTGYGHIAVGVDDLDGTLAALKDGHGIEPERPPYQVSEGGSRICFVRDPDDYRIELIERR